ncbi:hypothetical protein ACFVTX_14485 [Agromyces sp. NPDC058136]|uniref:hypothetical protein n=1 Tax=Agromyces sp. NPDC058136 TaxID=3346354 RepID=UPI0036DDEF69
MTAKNRSMPGWFAPFARDAARSASPSHSTMSSHSLNEARVDESVAVGAEVGEHRRPRGTQGSGVARPESCEFDRHFVPTLRRLLTL